MGIRSGIIMYIENFLSVIIVVFEIPTRKVTKADHRTSHKLVTNIDHIPNTTNTSILPNNQKRLPTVVESSLESKACVQSFKFALTGVIFLSEKNVT